jgi:hypothetical protein
VAEQLRCTECGESECEVLLLQMLLLGVGRQRWFQGWLGERKLAMHEEGVRRFSDDEVLSPTTKGRLLKAAAAM